VMFFLFTAAAGAGFWFLVARPEAQSAAKAGERFLGLLLAGKTDEAYQLTTPEFQRRNPLEEFRKSISELELTETEAPSLNPTPSGLDRWEASFLLPIKPNVSTYTTMRLVKVGAQWKIDAFEAYKPPPATPDSPHVPAGGDAGADVDSDDLITRGNEAFKSGDYDEALKLYAQVIEHEPKNAAALFARANTYYAQDEYEKALADYDRAIAAASDQPDYFNNRGNARYALGQYDEAIGDYSRAIQLDPKDAIAYFNRGNARRKLDDDDAALGDYNSAIQIDPKYAAAFSGRANLYYDQEQYEKAISDFNRAIALAPDNGDYLNNRGNAYFGQAKYDRALSDYTRVLELAPDYSDGYFNRANTYVKLKDLPQASADYEKAIALDPTSGDAMNRYARLLATTADAGFRNPAKALTLATKANGLTEWKRPYYLDTIAAASAAAGDFASAVKYETQALAKLGKDGDADTVATYRARLDLYKKKKPFVDEDL
jgi:tetratricopeptide (TPR) repeat protein